MSFAVVADDITGANDIGIMLARAGHRVHVYAVDAELARHLAVDGAPDALVVDTDSRFDAPEQAYRKVHAATLALREAGYDQFFNKTCSVFRGNIGAEFDAMLDALGEEFAVVVLGFPKNGRLTLDGTHYVHGRRLEESEFACDPMHPMTRSNLVEILQSQTRRRVGHVDRAIVAQGPAALRERLAELRPVFNYVILDVEHQAALATIAEAVHDQRVLCGSSALAEELPRVWGWPDPAPPVLDLPAAPGLGVLVAAGSLMPQTTAQIEHLRAAGALAFELPSQLLFDPAQRAQEVLRLAGELAAGLAAGRTALLHSEREPGAIARTRAVGAKLGLAPSALSRLVSGTIAEIVALTIGRTGLNRLIVAGGDTSAAVCQQLGVDRMRVWKEIQPGLPSCLSLAEPRMLLVLKSGSFGHPDFFEQAVAHLQAE